MGRVQRRKLVSGLYRSVARVAEGCPAWDATPAPSCSYLWPSLEPSMLSVSQWVGVQETMEAECRKEQALLGDAHLALTWQGPLEAAAVG